ncbi:hypothetical protein ACF059_31235 [Streptomyces sp. NPDC016562]|uniref:hypothetical protein n=1 Tax=Streptomyces sp. NPDC016562 TaxID=3364966 RepID=UPI0037014B87
MPPDAGAAADQRIVQPDDVGVQVGAPQEFEEVGGAEDTAEDLAVAADAAPASLASGGETTTRGAGLIP